MTNEQQSSEPEGESDDDRRALRIGLGFALGLPFGAGFGMLLWQNEVLGALAGAAVGLAIALIPRRK